MFRKVFLLGGLLVAVGVLGTAEPVQARPAGHGGGGFHGGGFHGGGFHGGGFHAGGFRGGFHGGYYGGFRGAYPHYGYGHYGYRHYGYRYPGYYRDGYPYYGSYGYSYPYYSNYYTPSYGYSDDYLGSGYSDTYPDSTAPVDPGVATPAVATPPVDNTAHLTVTVPANAKVWFDGTATKSTGTVRSFRSPSLTPGRRYGYTVRARWDDHGHEVTQTQRIQVTAGNTVQVHFPQQPTASKNSPAKAQH
jgi:uncharacterized protein (TIGR03000 family)